MRVRLSTDSIYSVDLQLQSTAINSDSSLQKASIGISRANETLKNWTAGCSRSLVTKEAKRSVLPRKRCKRYPIGSNKSTGRGKKTPNRLEKGITMTLPQLGAYKSSCCPRRCFATAQNRGQIPQ